MVSKITTKGPPCEEPRTIKRPLGRNMASGIIIKGPLEAWEEPGAKNIGKSLTGNSEIVFAYLPKYLLIIVHKKKLLNFDKLS